MSDNSSPPEVRSSSGMYHLLFFLAIAAAHTVVAGYAPSTSTSIGRKHQAETVDNFLEKLNRVSNDTLFNLMMGTAIGADVNHSSSLLTGHA